MKFNGRAAYLLEVNSSIDYLGPKVYIKIQPKFTMKAQARLQPNSNNSGWNSIKKFCKHAELQYVNPVDNLMIELYFLQGYSIQTMSNSG